MVQSWTQIRKKEEEDMSKGLKIMSLGVINHGMSLSVLYIDSIELYWFNFCVCNFQIESEWSLMNSNAAVRGRNSNDCFIGQSSSRSDTSITTTVVTTIIGNLTFVDIFPSTYFYDYHLCIVNTWKPWIFNTQSVGLLYFKYMVNSRVTSLL